MKLQYRRMDSGLPILSKKEIDILAEALVYDFCPERMKEPGPIDIDLFCESYMGLNQEFFYLSHCGLYLGMMVFADTQIPVYNPETGEAEYVFVKGDSVLIDNSLADSSISMKLDNIKNNKIMSFRQKQMEKDRLLQKKKSTEHRYRFTLAHEAAGHAVLHKEYFDKIKSNQAMVRCRISEPRKEKDIRAYTDVDWMEIQADHMAASFLMPARMVNEYIFRIKDQLEKMWESYRYYYMVMHISEVFNVSIDAAKIRLKELGLIPAETYQKI